MSLMTCTHPRASVVVWNDLAEVHHETGEVKVAGRLTVAWCEDCGAIKRDFPSMKIDWEIPKVSQNSVDYLLDPAVSG